MRVRPLTVALVALGCLAPVAALATHERTWRDPGDTPGPLDVRRVETFGAPPKWRIVTGPRWTVRRLWDRGYFYVRFDTWGDADFDRYALVRSNGRRLIGTMWRVRAGRDRRVGWLRVRRSSNDDVVVRVPRRKLAIGVRRAEYRWQVRTTYLSTRCANGVCIDATRVVVEPLAV